MLWLGLFARSLSRGWCRRHCQSSVFLIRWLCRTPRANVVTITRNGISSRDLSRQQSNTEELNCRAAAAAFRLDPSQMDCQHNSAGWIEALFKIVCCFIVSSWLALTRWRKMRSGRLIGGRGNRDGYVAPPTTKLIEHSVQTARLCHQTYRGDVWSRGLVSVSKTIAATSTPTLVLPSYLRKLLIARQRAMQCMHSAIFFSKSARPSVPLSYILVL